MTDPPTSIPRRVTGAETLSSRPLSVWDRGRAWHMQKTAGQTGDT